MATPSVDFRVSNDQAWRGSFSFLIGVSSPPPWAIAPGIPAWAPNTAYTLGLARTYQGELYVTEPGTLPASWTSASTFQSDVDTNGKPRWRRYGSAVSYQRKPVDLTGAKLLFALAANVADGAPASSRAILTASSEDGGFVITNATASTVQLDVPFAKTSAVPAGTYRHGMYATWPDGRGRVRLRYGLWVVDQGIVTA